MKRLMLLTSALIFSASMSMAAITATDLVTAYQALGYTAIDVITGPTQIKVDAVQGRFKVEVIYDAKTGAILSQHSVNVGKQGVPPGVVLTTQSKDFLGKGVGGQNGKDDTKETLVSDEKGDHSEASDDQSRHQNSNQAGDQEGGHDSGGGSGHKSSESHD